MNDPEQYFCNRHRPLCAMGLTIIAGLTTCIGAGIVLSKKLTHLAKPSNLALALGASAGVMIYISLTEIFVEAVDKVKEWNTHCHANCSLITNNSDKCERYCEGNSLAIVTGCFFGGAVIIFVLDRIIHKISPEASHELNLDELNALGEQLDSVENGRSTGKKQQQINIGVHSHNSREQVNNALTRTGLLTAVALAIHNFPEGFAVFTDVVNKESSKVPLLVIGIALHNIPEGVAVAAPVYYAKKSKLLAFAFTLGSAIAEPLGGGIAWIIKASTDSADSKHGNPLVIGITFGLVAGMMVTIALKELIPNAYRFSESTDKITISISFGMLFIAISVILLAYFGL